MVLILIANKFFIREKLLRNRWLFNLLISFESGVVIEATAELFKLKKCVIILVLIKYPFNMTKSKKAFTLIELLVVIAIIGILATISIVSLTNARAKSRDAKRAGDMKQVQTALELFFNDKGRYPSASEWDTNQIFSTSTGATSTYMQIIPSAPTPADGRCTSDQNSISYIPTSDGASYSISFCLGGNTGTLASGPKCLTPGGVLDVDCSGATAASFTLTYEAGANGSLVGDSPQTVNSGDDGSAVLAVADFGYHFVNWSDASTANPRTDTSVLANISVTANFAVDICGGVATVSYEGQVYNTIAIGTQCWFKENLNVGTRIDASNNQTDNSIVEKYCYNDSSSICDTDGGLYQWNEAMQYSTVEGAQGICPTGWHIPTDAEQNTLDQYLTVSPNTCNASRDGSWACATAGATLQNSAGFNIILTGNSQTDSWYFGSRGSGAQIWSSSMDGSDAWDRRFSLNSDVVGRHRHNRGYYGFSVRCIQN